MMAVDAAHAKIKIPGSLRKVYQRSGSVRDLQLHIDTIGNNTASVGYIQKLQEKLAAAKAELAGTTGHEVLPECLEKIEKKIKGDLADKIIDDFVSGKVKEISMILAHKIIRDGHLHAVRKCLKDIIYVVLIYRKELLLPFHVDGWKAENEKPFTDIATTLGRFQDSCISLTHLKDDLKAVSSLSDKKLITQIYRQQSRLKRQQKQLLKKDLLTLITSFSDSHH